MTLPEEHAPPRPPDPAREGAGAAPADPLEAARAELARMQARLDALEAQNRVLGYSQRTAESASARFETLFSSVPLALMVIDEYDMVVQSNAMAQRIFQPTLHDRPLTSLMPFVSAGHIAKVNHGFSEARRQGRSEAAEVVFAIGDAGTMTGDLHIRRIDAPRDHPDAFAAAPADWPEDEGTPAHHYICAIVDQGPLLAERRALQDSAMELQQRNEQLRASESRLEAVIDSALDAIVCVDAQQRITVFNPAAAALFQCPAPQALGTPLSRFLPDAPHALSFSQISTNAMLGEMTARTATGHELMVEVSASFEQRDGAATTTLFAHDLTGRKKAEAHRAMLEAQLRESQKMQAVGTMAGGIAHDFNNILSAILGNVDLAMADAGPDSPAQLSLAEIGKAGRRARDLVRQILTFSRNEPSRRQPVAIAEVIAETARLLRVTLPPQIELHLRAGPALPPILGDATQVEQALLNLGTNAVHALGDTPGSISIGANEQDPPQALRDRLGLHAQRYVAVSVTDTGSGMDAGTIERIFEPFFTTKPVGQGTGLGLAVVHGVMRNHQGATDVRSEPGRGSAFTLYFPVPEAAEGAAAAAAVASPPADPPASAAPAPGRSADEGRGRHVLYVDDDQALVFLVRRLLTRRGYRVTGLTDPSEAEGLLRDTAAHFDLLVTDYNMPGYSGVDLVRAAKSVRPELPVALASGHITTEIERAAREAGALELIYKPNDVEELCATVQRLVSPADGD
ncbi:MAG: ATP-binding protein [Xylophilus ampelinus]